MLVPEGSSARQFRVPKRLTSLVSWISEMRLPRSRVAGREPNHRTRVTGSQQQGSVGLGKERENLSRIELGDRGGLMAVLADLE